MRWVYSIQASGLVDIWEGILSSSMHILSGKFTV